MLFDDFPTVLEELNHSLQRHFLIIIITNQCSYYFRQNTSE